MNNNRHFFKAGHAALVSGALLLATLTGCIVDGPRDRVYVATPPMEATVIVQDDYVYYPGYDVYYSSNRRQYLWLDGGAWVSGPGPRGVSVNVLMASPSVRMDFHDSPALHHAAIVRQYPKNWAPPDPEQGRKEIRKDDKREERGGNDRK
jgi:hypothetical protein